MPNALIIRPMIQADLSSIIAIQTVCYTELIPESIESLTAKLLASPTTCFVASRSSQVLGYLFAVPWTFANPPSLNAMYCVLPKHPDCLYLHDLAVAPEARKLNVGQALVKQFLYCFHDLPLRKAALIAVQKSASYWQGYGFSCVHPNAVIQQKLSSYGNDVNYMVFEKGID